MASASKRGFPFRRQPRPAHARTVTVSSPRRGRSGSLVSSAARLDVADRQEAKVQRMLRQGWQSDAWSYRDMIGELRYAVQYLANCTARMRLYPACYPIGGESDDPVAVERAPGIPEAVISVCGQAMQDLGNGRLALAGMLHGLSTHKSVAGECYLLGRTDPQDGEQRWSVRSVDELVVYNDQWHLRETPDDRQNSVIPWIKLEPELTVISRIWTPHPRFQLLADSPMRAMLDDCESLTILRRMIRATGRSRLASRGLLFVPEEISIKAPDDDDDDPQADPFIDTLTEAMMAPIVNEGTADGVVPIVLRGPADAGQKIRLIEMAQTFDEQASKTREELIGIIATTFDLPKEIIMGIADLNHWSAWQVDDSTFRAHVEPHVIGCCDDLSAAYLRPYLSAAGVPDMWVQRMVLWYDPTELVTHPDRTQDAENAYRDMVISAQARRREAGFSEADAPSLEELEARRLWDIRALPLNLLMEYARRADPTLLVPPITVSGTVPGIKPGGVDTGTPPPGPGAAGGEAPDAGAAAGPSVPAPTDTTPPGPPPTERPDPKPPAPIIAAGASAQAQRLSRKLASIDSDLRARLQTAANAHLLRALERSGARLRTRVAKDETLRRKIAHRPNERAAAILGRQIVTAAGIGEDELLSGDWSALRSQFYAWTKAAQEQALQAAVRIAGIDTDSAQAAQASEAMAAGRDAAWAMLAEAMSARGQHLLYNPDPNAGAGDWGDQNPDTLIPAGTIRAALAIAGGAPASTALLDPGSGAVTLDAPVGQIGTGEAISSLIQSAGGQSAGYEWVHGPSLHPFEAHEALDGVQFQSFDDPQLANDGDFPDSAYYMPGDHEGCSCDFMPIFLPPE